MAVEITETPPLLPIKQERQIVVHEVQHLPGNIWLFRVRCYAGTGLGYHPAVDLETGLVNCDCPGFILSKFQQAEASHQETTVLSTGYHCKHIRHMTGILWRAGHISQICLSRCLWLEEVYEERMTKDRISEDRVQGEEQG